MDKKQRNNSKKALKKKISQLIGKDVSCSAKFNHENQTWEVMMSVDFDVPEKLNQVKVGMDKDIQQEDVVEYMKGKEQEIISVLNNELQAVYKPLSEGDFNFTVYFPPMFSTKHEDGILRLKTQEEREQDKKDFPSLLDMIKSDDVLLKSGFFEFRGEEAIAENDGFALVKYAGLRARYTFIVPHKEEAVLQ